MPEVLDQKEIDALLSAVDAGQVDLDEAQPLASPSAVRLYDFRRPERVSKEHLRALEAMHEAFARSLGASLSTFIRSIVEARVASVEQCTYGEFILALGSPTCFYLLNTRPIEGNLILELSPSLLFPILDRLLGGGREAPIIPPRPVTEIEQRLADRLVERALKALAQAWQSVQPMELTIAQRETNPQLIQVLPAGEVVVWLAFEITIGETRGTLNLCLPYAVIEPIMNRISRASRLDFLRREPDGQNAPIISEAIARAPIELTVYVAETTITVGDLLDLKVGDILKTDKGADTSLLVTVEGRPKFRGRAGQHRGRKALIIDQLAAPHDRI